MFLCRRSLVRPQTLLRITSNALFPTPRCQSSEATTTAPPKLKKKPRRKKPDTTLLNVLSAAVQDEAESIDSKDPIATPIEPSKSKRSLKREKKLPAKSKTTPTSTPKKEPKWEKAKETEPKRGKTKETSTESHYPIAYTRRVEGLIEPLKKPVLTGQFHVTVRSSSNLP
jgi:hypothetical protein